jgi:hypothetical protein
LRVNDAARSNSVRPIFGLVAASVVVRELRGESVIDRSNGCDPWAHPGHGG